MKRQILFIFTVLFFSLSAFGQKTDSLNNKLADLYFKITDVLCSFDNSQLWGQPLNGPLLFVDPQTRNVAANQADFWGNLAPKGNIFVGKLPQSITIANSVVNWGGIDWAMLMWPLSEDKNERNIDIIRQQFKRIAPKLGVPTTMPTPMHIDESDARILIHLEWRALNSALRLTKGDKTAAIKDALYFRKLRHTIYPGGATQEKHLELMNGLAEYTALKVSQLTNQQINAELASKMNLSTKLETFMGIYGEISGLFYALLLDQSGMIWRKGLSTHTDLGELVRQNFLIPELKDVDNTAKAASQKYDVEEIRAAEKKRVEELKQRKEIYKKKLVQNPVLTLILEDAVLAFDPRSSVPFGGLGTIYPNLIVNDNWGRLIVKSGALVNDAVSRLHVPKPKPEDITKNYIETEDFILELKDGWYFAAGKRSGDLELKRKQ